MLAGEYDFKKVSKIHEMRNWINVDGYIGSFQRDDVVKFTNTAPTFIKQPEPFFSDQYGSVYQRGELENIHVGKLNGRSLKEFLNDKEAREMSEHSES